MGQQPATGVDRDVAEGVEAELELGGRDIDGGAASDSSLCYLDRASRAPGVSSDRENGSLGSKQGGETLRRAR
jgi:hypothetical protein